MKLLKAKQLEIALRQRRDRVAALTSRLINVPHHRKLWTSLWVQRRAINAELSDVWNAIFEYKRKQLGPKNTP